MNCDCQFMPGITGKTFIDGYDTKSLYEQWQVSKAIRSELKLSEEEIKTAFKELGLRTVASVDPEYFVYEWIDAKELLGDGASVSDIAAEMAKNKKKWLNMSIEGIEDALE